MRVYHFLSAGNALSDLVFKRLRVSRYAALNDPFELRAFNLGDPAIRKAVAAYREDFNKHYGLLCFCRNTVNPLPWSHYADKHQGFALGFDISDKPALTVEYSKDRVVVEFENNDPSAGRITERSMRALLVTKFKDWDYEEEVRVRVDLEDAWQEAGSFFVPFGKQELVLREVIAGAMNELPLLPLHEFLRTSYGQEVELFRAALTYKWYAIAKQKIIVEGSTMTGTVSAG